MKLHNLIKGTINICAIKCTIIATILLHQLLVWLVSDANGKEIESIHDTPYSSRTEHLYIIFNSIIDINTKLTELPQGKRRKEISIIHNIVYTPSLTQPVIFRLYQTTAKYHICIQIQFRNDNLNQVCMQI